MITVNDQVGVLSGTDVQMLESIRTPFDVHVLVTSRYSKSDLELHVHDLVTTANAVVVGVDPQHHATFTHFGTGTGVRRSDYASIARAGTGEFRAGHWADGIRAIVTAANAASSQTQTASVVIQQPTQVVEKSTPVWPFVLGGAVLLLIGWLLYRKLRQKQQEVLQAAADAADEVDKLRARNEQEARWSEQLAPKIPQAAAVPRPAPAIASVPPAPGYGRTIRQDGTPVYTRAGGPAPVIHMHTYAPPAQPVVVNSGRGDGFLEGVLVGEALNNRPVIEERVVRERVIEEPAYRSRDRDDDGGSSSFFGGSSSSSDDDGGGGSSSWDSDDSSSSSGGNDGGSGGDSW